MHSFNTIALSRRAWLAIWLVLLLHGPSPTFSSHHSALAAGQTPNQQRHLQAHNEGNPHPALGIPLDDGSTGQIIAAAQAYQQVIGSYQHSLSVSRRQKALVNMGASLRLRRVINDMQQGKEVSIGIIGGSISWGFYMKKGVNDWFAVFTAWLQKAFPKATIRQKNGCVPATTAEYVSMCLDKFVDRDVDIIFVEYAVNEAYTDTSVNTQHAQAFERLIRKLLHLPHQPAVVLMQALAQGIKASHPPFYWTVQDHYGVLAQYYQLPWLSIRDAMFFEVLSGAPGFRTWEIYPAVEQDMQRHPSELGHKYMADVAVAMLQRVFEDMLVAPLSLQDEWSQKLLQVPQPMFPNNYESRNLACLIGETFPTVVQHSPEWQWVNDGTEEKPKWGFSTKAVGATLNITIDTRVDINNTLSSSNSTAGSSVASKSSNSSLSSGSSSDSTLKRGNVGSSIRLEAGSVQAGSGDVLAGPEQHNRNLLAAADAHAVQDGSSDSVHSSSSSSKPAFALMGQQLSQQAQEAQHKLDPNDFMQIQQQQYEVRDEAWWEAQQAQAEEQKRSKMEEAYRGYQQGDMLVWVGYTKTWRDAGRAVLTCHGGCSCKNVTVDAYHRWKTTQSFMAKLYTQQATSCTIRVTVLPQSSSGGSYFKVSGVMVTRRIHDYDGSDHTDVLLLNTIEGEEYKGDAFG